MAWYGGPDGARFGGAGGAWCSPFSGNGGNGPGRPPGAKPEPSPPQSPGAAQGSGRVTGAGDAGEPHHHPLDDDVELAHLDAYIPPPIDVARDVEAEAGRKGGQLHKQNRIAHVRPLGPLEELSRSGEHAALAPDGSPARGPAARPAPAAEPAEEEASSEPLPVAAGPAADPSAGGAPKIRAFEQQMINSHGESQWTRKPNVTGRGAVHVRSFHCKLTGECMEFLDHQINEWLDAHPEYEVKMVTTSVGDWSGKTREPALIVNVWV